MLCLLFRRDIASLTDVEYLQCLRIFGKTNLIDMLYSGFLYNMYIAKTMDKISTINKIINQIIISRQQQPQQSQHLGKDIKDVDIDMHKNQVVTNASIAKVDALPSPLIHNLISDSTIFERSNRSIFIACRSTKVPIHSLTYKQYLRMLYHHQSNQQLNIFKSIEIDGNADNLHHYINLKKVSHLKIRIYENRITTDCRTLYNFDFSNINSLSIYIKCDPNKIYQRYHVINVELKPLEELIEQMEAKQFEYKVELQSRTEIFSNNVDIKLERHKLL